LTQIDRSVSLEVNDKGIVMSRFFLPVWALVLTACQVPVADPACRPGPAERSAWSQSTKVNTPNAYRDYLAKYPSGCYAAVAAERLKKPVKAVGIAGVKANGVSVGVPAGTY